MAITTNKLANFGQDSKVYTSFTQINSSDYTTTKIQENVQKMESSLTTQINQISTRYSIAYSEIDLDLTGPSILVFNRFIDQNSVYDYTTGRMTCISTGINTISGLLNVSSGSLAIGLFLNGAQVADLIDGSGIFSFCISNKMTQGDTLFLKILSGTGIITGYNGGFGCQLCLGW